MSKYSLQRLVLFFIILSNALPNENEQTANRLDLNRDANEQADQSHHVKLVSKMV